jgi:O-succinylbenzoic acid--CoA ligase
VPQTKVIAAQDSFGALLALQSALAGDVTLFIASEPKDELTPKAFNLADEYQDVALIIETSGSTAKPKRVALSREALLASANASAERIGGSGQWLLALPTNYIAGAQVLIRSIVAETQPVMLNTSVPFSAEGFANLAALMTGDKRFTSLVPTQLVRLDQAAEVNDFVLKQLQSFDAILVGGQATDSHLLSRLRNKGVNLVTTYGLSETAGGCVYDDSPLGGVTLRIREELIEISSPTLANGYLQGGPSDAFFDEAGTRWFRTTDLGEISNGSLRVLGRADRVFISGGVKTSLDEVEAVTKTIPGVVRSAAVALRDDDWGERAAVIYVGSPEVADELAGVVLANLGPAANPVRVIRVDEIPKLANGKTDYRAITNYFESA